LRIAEGRGVEVYGQLQEMAAPPPSLPQMRREDVEFRGGVYSRLCDLFRKADTRYNSGLFHFKEEKGVSGHPDTFTLSLSIDDKVLQDILENLYYPESPYVFSEIPSDILGQVYERFLGKVIRLTPGGQAKVEEKPEVRKAGGVYYTPTYIVDYIVENTVGKLLEGKTPTSASKLKIVDPACGSGTFLLGAFQHLIDWHLSWYVADGTSKWAKKKVIFEGRDGWQLTLDEKKRILTNNLFGVDIDAQAVEVTKLSLLLKVIEKPGQLDLLAQRILPDLSANIKCGNSLIGSDYYDDKQMPLLPDEEFWRVNAFDWQKAFKDIFTGGGFDAVIGNPPYIRIQAMKAWAPDEVEFYKSKYLSAKKGNYDIYVVFVEKALKLLNTKGLLGFILPHKFFNAKYGAGVRKILSDGKHLSKIVHFSDQQVFANATTYTCLLFLNQSTQKEFEFEKVDDLAVWQLTAMEQNPVAQNPEFFKNSGFSESGTLTAEKATEDEWNFVVGKGGVLFESLSQFSTKLENVAARIFQGIKTSADKIYIVEKIEETADKVKVFSKEKNVSFWMEKSLLHPLVKGGNSKRYNLTDTKRLLLFPYQKNKKDNGYHLILDTEFEEKYPLIWKYLLDNKTYLENRERGRMKGKHWYAYIYPKNFNVMPLPKIFVPDIAPKSSFSLDKTGEYYFTGGAAGGYGILIAENYSREYVLGLLNSKLLEWYLQQFSTSMRGGWYSYEARYIRKLPVRTINFDDPAETAQHAEMVALVERMLALHEQKPQSPREKEMLQRQIEMTDATIDRLVYQLYGLTEEEIGIVEG